MLRKLAQEIFSEIRATWYSSCSCRHERRKAKAVKGVKKSTGAYKYTVPSVSATLDRERRKKCVSP